MSKKVIETIISSLLLAIVMFLFNLLSSNFIVEKGTIRISEPIEIDKNQFQISVSILNFSNKNINNLEIKLPIDVPANNIIVTQPVTINKVVTNYGNTFGAIFRITKVAEHQNISMVIMSSQKIETNQVVIDKNGNNIEVEYFNKVSSPYKRNIDNLIINAIIYAALFAVTNYLTDRRRQKLQNEYTERLEISKRDIQEDTDRIKKRLEEQEKERLKIFQDYERLVAEVEKLKDTHIKWKIIYQSKLKDFSKELNFWRDTIRKIIYKSSDTKIEADELFITVTKSLQTYQTRVNAEDNYDTLKVMSKMFEERT
ncbi:hypothetical protein [Paenibacillus vini]|uniref:Uncharacterized protein n=1 Tax=Paenibacillus vini TaxID=1476024 RepID=A0ABQ4MFN8_9BACL|nr:hypothetical protein [Paenibacillus vini]GIP54812.1 hypothetical protein J42TS3_38470 [Paenibacillus vini]